MCKYFYWGYLWLLVWLCFSINGRSQDSILNEAVTIADYISGLMDQTGEEMDLEVLNDFLFQLSARPVIINSGNKEEIKRLFWLSDYQIDNLMLYVKSNGYIRSVYEIIAIAGFGETDVRMIQPYITFDVPDEKKWSLAQYFSNRRQKLLLRTQKVLEEQAGFKKGAYNEPPAFEGNNFRIYSRYTLYNPNFSAGITGEKDAGETFFSGSNKNGFDFYSYHLQLSNLGMVKTVVLGDYRANFGSGLVTGPAFGLGKVPSFMGAVYQNSGITKYTSTDENNFFRGVAVTLVNRHHELSLFYSSHALDGNITKNDSLSKAAVEVSSLQTTGYHTTFGEIADEDALTGRTGGGHYTFRSAYFEVGSTVLVNHFSAPVNPAPQTYNSGYFRGSHNINVSVDYRFRIRKVLFFGEGAMSGNKASALLAGMQAYVTSGIKISSIYRNYSNSYQALYGNAFGENSRNQNERGIYIGLQCKLLRGVSFTGFTDYVSFPAPKYGVDFPSQSQEYMGQINYAHGNYFSMYVQYREKIREVNLADPEAQKNILALSVSRHYRLNLQYKATSTVELKNRLEYSVLQMDNDAVKEGYFIAQDIIYKPEGWPLQLYLRYALFDTGDYDSRIYSYESDLLYTFSIPAFYDKGSRFYVMTKIPFTQNADIWIKYAVTTYADKSTISSGLYAIDGNRKSELKLQLLMQF